MSQFHVDFDMPSACGDIYSKGNYFIAKKVYIDKLESVDKDGNTTDADHIRMKSIPTDCIKYTSKQNGLQPIDLYKQLFNGIKINFDLTQGGECCGFKYERDMSVRSYNDNEFNRCIGFTTDVEKVEVS